jgi:hypothetical protein
MKVIKPGNTHKAWTRKLTCTGSGNGGEGCGAVLEVTFTDIYETANCDYMGDCDHYKTFCCPCCGAETDISTKATNYYQIETLGKRPTEAERTRIKVKYMAGE